MAAVSCLSEPYRRIASHRIASHPDGANQYTPIGINLETFRLSPRRSTSPANPSHCALDACLLACSLSPTPNWSYGHRRKFDTACLRTGPSSST